MCVVLLVGKTEERERGGPGEERRQEDQLCLLKVGRILLVFVTAESGWL